MSKFIGWLVPGLHMSERCAAACGSWETLQRVKEPVALLQSEKPEQFCAPHCLGYFDDRDDSSETQDDPSETQDDHRFGLVFEKPNPNSMPKSPRLGISRHEIATCVLYLHAVDWLRKALRSDNILFFPDNNKANLGRPKLTGFAFARPDTIGETSTTGEANEWCGLYVHPNYQGSNAKGTYWRIFDIYNLVITTGDLISYWKPIEQIVGTDPDCAQLAELKSIRSRLLDPGAGHLGQVLADQGEKDHEAVKCCPEGRAALGIGQEEDEADVLTGAKLQ